MQNYPGIKKWDKTILTVLLRWDYGQKARGESADKLWFYDNFLNLAERVEVFWYDDYLKDLPLLQESLLAKTLEVNPDLIFFIPFQEQFQFATLDRLKETCPTLAWFGDDTWRFDSFSSRYAPHFTYIATTDLFSMDKYRKIGAQPILTEWAAAEPLSKRIGPLGSDESYEYDVSFVGGKNECRSWMIKMLARTGIKVECFGAGWANGRVSFAQMEQIFRTSRINLNISNSINHDIRFICSSISSLANYLRTKKRAEQVKARNFEIPLAGGFQLSNYVLGLERHLQIGREVVVYNSPEECAQLIDYYLENKELRLEVLRKGHDRAMNEHTYRHRLISIMEAIWGGAKNQYPGPEDGAS